MKGSLLGNSCLSTNLDLGLEVSSDTAEQTAHITANNNAHSTAHSTAEYSACNTASAEMTAFERANQIFDKVSGNSSDKSVLPECEERARDLFKRFNDRFALSDFELGTTDLYEHDIVIKDENDLPRMAGRPVPLGYRKPLLEMLRTYLAMGVISLSSSEYSSPVVLVRKKVGSLSLCIDY